MFMDKRRIIKNNISHKRYLTEEIMHNNMDQKYYSNEEN